MAKYEVTTAAARLEFDTLLSTYNSCYQIDSNHFINFWAGNGSDGYVQAFTVDTSTWAVTTANASLEFDTVNGTYNSCYQIDSNHFINFWAGVDTDGYVQAFTVNTSTWAVTTANASLEFDTVNGTYNSCCKIDANHFINFWAGVDTDGFVQVFTVNTSTWAVTTANASLEFDTVNGTYNSCYQIDSNHFINFWAGTGNGYVQVFTVNTTTWAVTTANSSLNFETSYGTYNSCYQIDSNHFINFYTGTGNSDGQTQVFTVNTTTWAVTAGARFRFDANSGIYNSCYQIDSNHFINFWAGTDQDGYVQVFTVNTTTWAVTTANSSLEFDTVGGEHNSCYQIDSNHFINFWYGESQDGYVQVFKVTLAEEYTKTITEIIRVSSILQTTRLKTLIEDFIVGDVIAKVLSAKKVLTETIIATPVFTFIVALLRTFIEDIKIVSSHLSKAILTFIEDFIVGDVIAKVLSAKKVLTETIITIPVFASIATLLKTFTETIKTVGSAISQTSRTFIERINTIPVFSTILTALKTLVEQIKVVSVLKNAGTFTKTLIENVIVVPVYSTVLTASRAFVEAIRVAGNILKNTGRAFIEVISAISSSLFNTSKTFIESFIVASSYSRVITALKTFTETIRVIGNTIKTTGRTLISPFVVSDPEVGTKSVLLKVLDEAISAIGLMGSFVIGKLFVQPVKIVATFLRQSTLYKTLSEIVVAGGNLLKQTGRILAEVLVVSSSMVFTAGKVFVETIKTIGSYIFQTSRTLVEQVLIVSNAISTTARNFVERFAVVPIFSTIATLLKVLTERIVVVSSRLQSISKTFVESFNVIGNAIAQATLYKVLVDIVIATGQITKNTGRIFIENIISIPGVIYSTSKNLVERIVVISGIVNQIVRILVEAIKVTESRIIQGTRILIENMIVGSINNFLKLKTITEELKIISSTIYNVSRTFAETIIVSWKKLTYRAFTYTENLAVRGFMGSMAIGKRLIERVLGNTWFEFEKTQFVELTDRLKAGATFVKRTTRVFIERVIMASDVIIRYIGRLFSEGILINGKGFQDEIQLLYGRVLSEITKIGGALGEWVIGKVLPEIVKVYSVLAKASAWLMSETIKIVSGVAFSTARVFTETINTIVTFVKTLTAYKILTQVIRMTDTTRFRKTQRKVLTDQIKASVTIFRSVGRIIKESFAVVSSIGSWTVGKLLIQSVKVGGSIVSAISRTLTETVKIAGNIVFSTAKLLVESFNVISSMGNWVVGKLIVQPVIVVSNFIKQWTLARTFSEVVSVVSNITSQSVKIFTETIKIAGSFVLGTISKVLIEIVNIYGTIAKSLPKVFSEAVVVVSRAFNQAGKIFSENVVVVGQFILGTISKLLIEPIKVIAEYIKAWTLSRVISETLTVVDSFVGSTSRIFTETINVVGTFVLGTISKVLNEIVKVGDTIKFSITRVFAEIVKVASSWEYVASNIRSETIKVVGAMANFVVAKLLKESLKVGSSLVKTAARTFTQAIIVAGSITRALTGRVFSQPISVVSSITRSMGRLFSENVSIGWAKIKLVLNGIQVGLWKKIARVTTGTWRKISRNDN